MSNKKSEKSPFSLCAYPSRNPGWFCRELKNRLLLCSGFWRQGIQQFTDLPGKDTFRIVV